MFLAGSASALWGLRKLCANVRGLEMLQDIVKLSDIEQLRSEKVNIVGRGCQGNV